MNAVLVETWRDFKVSSAPVTTNDFKKTKLVPLTQPDEDTNTQACLASPQTPKGEKLEEIEVIARASIDPEDVVVIKKNYPIVILR